MMDVGRTTWEDGEKSGFNKGTRKERINSAIKYVKSLMKNNYTLEEALSLLEIDKKMAKIVRKRLKKS